MANISHKNLTGAQLHENKGVDSATADQVATASGAGATVWKKLTHANLQTTGNPFGAQLLHVREEQNVGVNSTSPATNNVANTVALNTVKTNEISGASLASNQITLPAGTYFVEGWATGCGQMSSGAGAVSNLIIQARLYNVSNSTTLINGSPCKYSVTDNNSLAQYVTYQTTSRLHGRFTLAGTTLITLQMYLNSNYATSGSTYTGIGTEIYSDLCIWKVA